MSLLSEKHPFFKALAKKNSGELKLRVQRGGQWDNGRPILTIVAPDFDIEDFGEINFLDSRGETYNLHEGL